MKTNQTFLSTRTHWATALLVTAVAVAVTVNSQAAKPPKPSQQENGSIEVLVTGAIYSLPDHTSNGDVIWPPDYDLCRNANFTIGGGTGLTLNKPRLYLPFVGACSDDGYNGPGFCTKVILSLGFGANPVVAPSPVTLQINLTQNYVVRLP